MKHPTNVPRYNGTIEQLAREMSKVCKDELCEFLCYLAEDINKQSVDDYARNRTKLSGFLDASAKKLYRSVIEVYENHTVFFNISPIQNYTGTLEELAQDIGIMTYDKTALFIDVLAKNLDFCGDDKKEKAADKLYLAKEEMDKAWAVCKPYMKP